MKQGTLLQEQGEPIDQQRQVTRTSPLHPALPSSQLIVDMVSAYKSLEKNKGKKKMKAIGRVEVPGDVFISALKLDD